MKKAGLASIVLASAALCGALHAPEAGAAGATAEGSSIEPGWRQQLAAQRREIEAASAARERECAQHFIVSSCLEASRATRREALAALNSREAALDDAERKQRAFEREERIKAKIAARDAASAPPQAPLEFVPSEGASRPRNLRQQALPSDSREAGPRKAPAKPDPAEVKAREAEARERFDARAREARQRQDAVEQRERDRERAGKRPAAPLPPATSASGGAASAPR